MSRSILFVPGDSLRKFDRAATGDSDALVLDLEDSVAPDAKPAARVAVREMLRKGAGAKPLWVRVNPLDTPWTAEDLGAVAAVDAVVLNRTYGDFTQGNARRAVLSPGVEHIGVLYSAATLRETLDWLGEAFPGSDVRASALSAEIDDRGPWLGLLLLASGLGFGGLGLAAVLGQFKGIGFVC